MQPTVWAVRRDGWMKRVPIELPPLLKIQLVCDSHLSCWKFDPEQKEPPENASLDVRPFVLERVNNHDVMPWGESCFYREI